MASSSNRQCRLFAYFAGTDGRATGDSGGEPPPGLIRGGGWVGTRFPKGAWTRGSLESGAGGNTSEGTWTDNPMFSFRVAEDGVSVVVAAHQRDPRWQDPAPGDGGNAGAAALAAEAVKLAGGVERGPAVSGARVKGSRLELGDLVVLAEGARKTDALQPGEVGEIVHDAMDAKPYKVKGRRSGKTSKYLAAADLQWYVEVTDETDRARARRERREALLEAQRTFSPEQERELEDAVRRYPFEDYPAPKRRWALIAAAVDGKAADDCVRHYRAKIGAGPADGLPPKRAPGELLPMAVHVVRLAPHKKRVHTLTRAKVCGASNGGRYARHRDVACACLLDRGEYAAVPSLHAPGVAGAFTLTVAGSRGVSLHVKPGKPLPEAGGESESEEGTWDSEEEEYEEQAAAALKAGLPVPERPAADPDAKARKRLRKERREERALRRHFPMRLPLELPLILGGDGWDVEEDELQLQLQGMQRSVGDVTALTAKLIRDVANLEARASAIERKCDDDDYLKLYQAAGGKGSPKEQRGGGGGR